MPTRTDLELRYDGPIPAQHLQTDMTRWRAKRGCIHVLETQAEMFMDEAERIAAELEDPSSDPLVAKRVDSMKIRLQSHIACAAESLQQAMKLRAEMNLPPHPLIMLIQAMRAQP